MAEDDTVDEMITTIREKIMKMTMIMRRKLKIIMTTMTMTMIVVIITMTMTRRLLFASLEAIDSTSFLHLVLPTDFQLLCWK